MSAAPEASMSNQICDSLHQLLGGLSAHTFPYQEDQIPRNGIYVLFEDGESAHGANRIVRIGTHTGSNQLRSRLKQHFLSERKDRSIFRKNVGRCLLNRDNDPFLEHWEIDLTSRAARAEYGAKIDLDKQNEIEKRVSEYIRVHLRFVTFEVQDKDRRLALESKMISTVSHCENCTSSATWLGRHSPKNKISLSGLWQVNELRKTPLSIDEIHEISRCASIIR